MGCATSVREPLSTFDPKIQSICALPSSVSETFVPKSCSCPEHIQIKMSYEILCHFCSYFPGTLPLRTLVCLSATMLVVSCSTLHLVPYVPRGLPILIWDPSLSSPTLLMRSEALLPPASNHHVLNFACSPA